LEYEATASLRALAPTVRRYGYVSRAGRVAIEWLDAHAPELLLVVALRHVADVQPDEPGVGRRARRPALRGRRGREW
jgi:hypothetical protein